MFVALISILVTSAFAVEGHWIDIGDMKVFQSAQNQKPSTKGAVLLEVELWEDGILPFEFDFEITDAQQEMFFDACLQWERVSGVRCKLGPYKGRVVTVTNTEGWGCYALWGMGSHWVFLKRKMNLQSSCWNKKTIMHELGHTMGLIHEHQRMDRNQYVEVISENLDSGFLWLNEIVNFNRQSSEPHTEYDFLSIMHYHRQSFSKNGGDTIVPKPGYEQYLDVMGRMWHLSDGDARIAADLYGPSKHLRR
jgi:hypothetical protein